MEENFKQLQHVVSSTRSIECEVEHLQTLLDFIDERKKIKKYIDVMASMIACSFCHEDGTQLRVTWNSGSSYIEFYDCRPLTSIEDIRKGHQLKVKMPEIRYGDTIIPLFWDHEDTMVYWRDIPLRKETYLGFHEDGKQYYPSYSFFHDGIHYSSDYETGKVSITDDEFIILQTVEKTSIVTTKGKVTTTTVPTITE
jgi:hypothetical protein